MINGFEQGYKKTYNFSVAARKAIDLLAEENNQSDKEILQKIESFGIDRQDAIDILLFIPMAFVRHLLPTFKWNEYFKDWINENHQISLKFTETKSYQLIFKVVEEYFAKNADSNIILKISSRSSEFQVINDLLNKGEKIDDIKLTETVLIRK